MAVTTHPAFAAILLAREAHEAIEWLPASEPRSALRALPEFVLSRLY
jgi:hypothetical protein